MPGKPWVSKPSDGLRCSTESVMTRWPVRSFDTKKMPPPPSLAWLSVIATPHSDSVKVLPSL